MKTHAVRLHGKGDLRLEQFELPVLKEDEILCKVMVDSLCMSSYKAQLLGTDHQRIPNDAAQKPVIIGHEFYGEILEVGRTWADRYRKGQKFTIQPALNFEDGPAGLLSAPGYSYPFTGGDATYIILPRELMAQDCLLLSDTDVFFPIALSEPYSCVIAAVRANYHGTVVHEMDIVEGGNTAVLGGTGPMGLAMIDYLLARSRKPKRLVVSGRNKARLERASSIFTVEKAAEAGVELLYIDNDNPGRKLMEISRGKGFDDVFVFAPSSELLEQGSAALARDACLNFFAGPVNREFSASINFYNVHYAAHHFAATSGGNTRDLKEAMDMIAKGDLHPNALITHVGGLDSVAEATKHLPEIAGGKLLIYTHKSMPLKAIDDFAESGKSDPFYNNLARICGNNNGLWCPEAETYVLEHAPDIQI